jgi:L-alanine-DL-glutamate epimerase-like enolase superfamily enzyme
MKIRRVATILARYPLAQPTGPSIWPHTHREVLLVRLATDGGLAGWGETCAMPGAARRSMRWPRASSM